MLAPPSRLPLLLRPAIWLARRMTGKDPLVARLLAHLPKAAVASGVLELLAAHAPGDLDARTLKLARLAASVMAGCPFCIDMNAAEFSVAGVTREEVAALVEGTPLPPSLDARARAAVELARAMSSTPVEIASSLRAELEEVFAARELVALTTAIAQVNYWARLNQSLDVPAAGFFFEPGAACRRMP
ncbi:MAG: carboxymuconolactone decarboxylase family protein [Labilithrix sp.]